jgi:hypothetical protein
MGSTMNTRADYPSPARSRQFGITITGDVNGCVGRIGETGERHCGIAATGRINGCVGRTRDTGGQRRCPGGNLMSLGHFAVCAVGM